MNSSIVPLMDDVRAHLRKISMGLVVVGVLLLAVDSPNWYGLFAVVGGLVIGAFGCVRFETANEWMHCPPWSRPPLSSSRACFFAQAPALPINPKTTRPGHIPLL